jgi:NADH-quinone oxidoreductase subunit A
VLAVFKDWVGRGKGFYALVEILMFVAVLVVGLIYVWRKGDLQWNKTVTEPVPRTVRDPRAAVAPALAGLAASRSEEAHVAH